MTTYLRKFFDDNLSRDSSDISNFPPDFPSLMGRSPDIFLCTTLVSRQSNSF